MNNAGLLIDEELIEDGRTVVLGISGGPDSVCLLYELLTLDEGRRNAGGAGNPVVCAHVNHGLRGEESDADEAWVEALCEKLGVLFEVLRIDAAALARDSGLTVEEAGRDARYAFFGEVCEKHSVWGNKNISGLDGENSSREKSDKHGGWGDKNISGLGGENSSREKSDKHGGLAGEINSGEPVIAVAHNREDQSETVLMRILRGTGTDGIAGMPKRRRSAAGFEIVRPLLGTSRKEIENRLAAYGAEARTDGSNSDAGYFRNKLRLEVFPYLENNLGLDLRQGLLRLAENAAEDKDFFDAVVAEALDEFLEYAGADEEPSPPCSSPVPETQKEPSPPCSYPATETQKEPSPLYSSPVTETQKEPSLPCSSGVPAETASMPAELLAGVHPAIRHRLIRAAFAELGLDRDIAAVHLNAAERLLSTWEAGGEASGKRVEFPQDYTFGITGKKVVFRAPGAVEPGWKPRRKL